MTREDIQLALRLVAHGRVNHPQVEELAEKLEKVFQRSLEWWEKEPKPIPVAEFVAAVDEAVAAPKRRKKAE